MKAKHVLIFHFQYWTCYDHFSCLRTSTQLSYSTTIISHFQQQSHPLNFQSNNILATLNSQSKPSSSSKILNAPLSPLIDSKVRLNTELQCSTSLSTIFNRINATIVYTCFCRLEYCQMVKKAQVHRQRRKSNVNQRIWLMCALEHRLER